MQYSGKITLTNPNRMIRSDFINQETAVEIQLRKTNLNKQNQNQNQNKKNVIASSKFTQTKNSANKYSNFDLRQPPILNSNFNKNSWKISQKQKIQDLQRQQRRKIEAKQFELQSKKTQMEQRKQIKSRQLERKKYFEYLEIEKQKRQKQAKAREQQQYKKRYEQYKKQQQRIQQQKIKNELREEKLRLQRFQRQQRIKQQQRKKELEKQRQRYQQILRDKKQKQRLEKQKLERQKIERQKRQQQLRKQQEKKLLEKKQQERHQFYKSQVKSTKLGLIGLNNIGNTCYMNSILQCLFNLPNFNNYFITSKYLQNLKGNGRVAQAYAKLVNLIKNTVTSSQSPSTLKQAVGSRNYQFASYKQQDAHEFLICLLQLMSQDLKIQIQQAAVVKNSLGINSLRQKSNQQWKKHLSKENSYINSNFCGQLLSSIQCQACGYKLIAFDNFWDIQLCFQKSKASSEQLTKMLDNYIKKETLDEYRCEKCQRKDNCVKQTLFSRLPHILVIHFKRFQYDLNEKGFKICNPVTYISELDMSPFLEKEFKNQKAEYTLCGIVKHSGTLDYGHYKAQCKNFLNNKWYEFNDSHVTECDKMKSSYSYDSDAYVLFYYKKCFLCVLPIMVFINVTILQII